MRVLLQEGTAALTKGCEDPVWLFHPLCHLRMGFSFTLPPVGVESEGAISEAEMSC